MINQIKIPGIRFIVTSLCNYNCNYCHNEWESKKNNKISISNNLEKKLIKKLIIGAKQLGAEEVDITGGEPLLKIEKILYILKIAKDEALWTNITTNGYFLDKYAKKLKSVGLKEIHIHIPSLDPVKYRSLMNGNADLKKVLNAIQKNHSLFESVKINIPIMKGLNDNEMKNFLDYFSSFGIIPRYIESMSTINYKGVDFQNFDDTLKHNLKKYKLKKEFLWGIKQYKSDGKLFEVLRCICFDNKCDICLKNNFVHIDQDYNIRPCNLRMYKISTRRGEIVDLIKKSLNFLDKHKKLPCNYHKLWDT